MARIPIGETELGALFHYDWSNYYYFVPINSSQYESYFEDRKDLLCKDIKNNIIHMSYEEFKNLYPFGNCTERRRFKDE